MHLVVNLPLGAVHRRPRNPGLSALVKLSTRKEAILLLSFSPDCLLAVSYSYAVIALLIKSIGIAYCNVREIWQF